MTYSEFLQHFMTDLRAVMRWVRYSLFPSSSNPDLPFFSNHMIFTIMAFSLLLFIIEEFVGILTSFRFGGLFFRLFRVYRPHRYDVDYKIGEAPDYSKEKHIRPYRFFFNPFYRAKYTGKYFIKYGNRYFPVKVPRYNPFAMKQFKIAYGSGKIISYDTLMKQNYSNSYNNSFNPSEVSSVRASLIRDSINSQFHSTPRVSSSAMHKLYNFGASIDSEYHPSESVDYLEGLGEELEEIFSSAGSAGSHLGEPGDWTTDKGILASEMADYFEGLNAGEYPDTMDPSDFL